MKGEEKAWVNDERHPLETLVSFRWLFNPMSDKEVDMMMWGGGARRRSRASLFLKMVRLAFLANVILLSFTFTPSTLTAVGDANAGSCSSSSPCCCRKNTKGKLYCCTSCACTIGDDEECSADDDCDIG